MPRRIALYDVVAAAGLGNVLVERLNDSGMELSARVLDATSGQ